MPLRLKRFRTELLLIIALLPPVLIPSGLGLDSLLSAPLALVPSLSAGEGEEMNEWRETSYRLMLENADLRERFFALDGAAQLVPLDRAYYERHPVRIEARVLARDASPYRGSLVISAGTREGVAGGQAVVRGQVLVGVVSRAGRFTSRVRLLADPGHRVWGVTAVRGGELPDGYLEGSGDELLTMRLVRAGAGAVGDPVFSGTGLSRVPRGLLVGTVERIEDIDRSGVAEVEVRPALDPVRLRIVNVLAPKGE
ncbi:MAG: rod shape-determining protein MreC [Planctomycetota bacterium]